MNIATLGNIEQGLITRGIRRDVTHYQCVDCDGLPIVVTMLGRC
jgi:hypothetical protein